MESEKCACGEWATETWRISLPGAVRLEYPICSRNCPTWLPKVVADMWGQLNEGEQHSVMRLIGWE
jgi:hypothetical protein